MDNVQGGGVLVKYPVSAPGPPPPLSKILDPRLRGSGQPGNPSGYTLAGPGYGPGPGNTCRPGLSLMLISELSRRRIDPIAPIQMLPT